MLLGVSGREGNTVTANTGRAPGKGLLYVMHIDTHTHTHTMTTNNNTQTHHTHTYTSTTLKHTLKYTWHTTPLPIYTTKFSIPSSVLAM